MTLPDFNSGNHETNDDKTSTSLEQHPEQPHDSTGNGLIRNTGGRREELVMTRNPLDRFTVNENAHTSGSHAGPVHGPGLAGRADPRDGAVVDAPAAPADEGSGVLWCSDGGDETAFASNGHSGEWPGGPLGVDVMVGRTQGV